MKRLLVVVIIPSWKDDHKIKIYMQKIRLLSSCSFRLVSESQSINKIRCKKSHW